MGAQTFLVHSTFTDYRYIYHGAPSTKEIPMEAQITKLNPQTIYLCPKNLVAI